MFKLEKELVKAFINKSDDFLLSSKNRIDIPYFLMEEFDSHHGIADIVIGTYRTIRRTELKRKAINWNWIRPLLNFSEEDYICTNYFTSQYGVSKTTAKIRLQEYAEAGFIFKDMSGYFRLGKRYEPVTETIIAIEAKLRNWQRALQQAIRYKRFSNQSYVLLDHRFINPALNNLDIFKEKNIGLLSMNQEGIKIHFQPNFSAAPQSHSYYRLNEAAVTYFNRQLANA